MRFTKLIYQHCADSRSSCTRCEGILKLDLQAHFSPVPLDPLPFPSIVVASTDDPFVTPTRAAAFAGAWGSRLVTFERAGHLNADAGFGPLPEGRRLLAELTKGESHQSQGQ